MDQDPVFQSVLNKFGFDLDVPERFSDIEFSETRTVPDPKSTITVPLVEKFPIEPPPVPENDGQVPYSQIESAGLELLQISRIPPKEPKKVEKNVPINFLPTENVEDFVLLKREMQTYFAKFSEEEKLPFKIEVCHFPTCLNNAVPTYRYCTYHMMQNKEAILKDLTKNKKTKH